MSGLPTMLHPTFDALSAHADQPGDVASATRIGRHVARCAQCRAEVEAVRAMGDAARAIVVQSAPADLWSRIEAAVSVAAGGGERRPPLSVRADLADAPMPMARRHRALITSVGLLGAAVLAAVLWPAPASLRASGVSRLTFSPSRPVPGGPVAIRYEAPARMKDASSLVLVGRFARPAGWNALPFGARVGGELADSVGALSRAPDGAFVGTVTLPADFRAVALSVLDRARDEADVDGAAPWLVIGGTPAHEASLASFLAAHEARYAGFNDASNSPELARRQAVNAPDSLKRYFPRHPAGWAYGSYGVARGRFDFLRFFESADRKYSAMFDALWPRPRLDAERLHDMVAFAARIDEPAEQMRWAARLASEHPEDPRALFDLAGALHALELRNLPSTGDSIRRWMPALDHAYRAGPVPNLGFRDALRLVDGYADAPTRALWQSRVAANGAAENIWIITHDAAGAKGDSAATEVRRRAEQPCDLPPGRLPLGETIADWRSRCELYRGIGYRYLSRYTLQGGRPQQALAEADSAIAAMARVPLCAPVQPYLERALAALALGDTATAARDFMVGSAAYPHEDRPLLDSVRVLLGPRFDETASRARADSVRRAAQACERARRQRQQAERRRLVAEATGGR